MTLACGTNVNLMHTAVLDALHVLVCRINLTNKYDNNNNNKWSRDIESETGFTQHKFFVFSCSI
jgi:hypothetical protein